jgi:hypothetical protein
MTRLGVSRHDVHLQAVRAKGGRSRRTDRDDFVRDHRVARATFDPHGRYVPGRVLDLLPRSDEGGVDVS